MGFSTKELHVALFDQLTPTDKAFTPLSSASLAKLISAVDHAIDLGEQKDVTVIATFCSDIFLQEDEAFASLMSFIETHADVKRITSTMSDSVTMVTVEGFVVTVRLIGCKKFVAEAHKTASTQVDDSFESVEDLTQRVLGIERCTPGRK